MSYLEQLKHLQRALEADPELKARVQTWFEKIKAERK